MNSEPVPGAATATGFNELFRAGLTGASSSGW